MWLGILVIMIFIHAASSPAHSKGCGLSPKSLNRPVRYGESSTYLHKHTHTQT
jgi:hypothetical protein